MLLFGAAMGSGCGPGRTPAGQPPLVAITPVAADAREPQPEPECCTRDGILWDLIAIYPSGVTCTDRLPPAPTFNGPVVDVTGSLEEALTSAGRAR